MTKQNAASAQACDSLDDVSQEHRKVENAIEHGGQYTITVPLGAVLKQDEKVKLFAAIRSSQDDCVAGGFLLNDGSVTFHREVENDCEFIVSNFTNMAKTNYEAAAMHQLAGEIMDSQPANEHLLQIVEALRGASGIQPRVENLRNPSQLLGNVLEVTVHDFSGRFPSDVYDQTQTDDSIKDGDVLDLGAGNVAILVKAWPTIVVGEIENFHRLNADTTFETFMDGRYAASAAKAREISRQLLNRGNVQDASHAQLFSCTWPCQFEGAKFTTMTRIVVDGAQPAVVAAQKWMHGQFVDFSNPDEFSYLQANVVELHKAQDDPIPWGLSRIDQAPEWSLTSKVPERYDSPSPGM